VSVHGRPVHLRRLDYALLRHLASDPRRVFTKLELMRAIWSRDETRDFHTLDSHASRIRCKLRATGGERWVINVRGVGYRLI
jgi:two-component system response regulator ResD